MKKNHGDDKIVAILCVILIILFIGLYYCGALKDYCEKRNHIHDQIKQENMFDKEDLHE